MFDSKKHSYADLIEGILIGGSLAALTTFMLGTQKGKKLQKELLQKADKFRADIEKAAKSPTARRVKRAVKKAVKRKVVAKAVRKIAAKRKVGRQRTVRH